MNPLEDQYFKNYEDIEKLWKAAREKEFADRKANDLLFGKCEEGRHILWQVLPVWKKQFAGAYQIFPSKIAAYQRAIMLLEKEERWDIAMKLIDNAIEIGLEKHGATDWYSKRKVRTAKKIK